MSDWRDQQPHRCASCGDQPLMIAEAHVGTPEQGPATGDLWVYLCVPCMDTFNAMPWPSAERSDFLGRVFNNVLNAEAEGRGDDLRPPHLSPEALACFDSVRLAGYVREEWGRLDLTQYEFLRRFPRRVLPPPRPRPRREQPDPDERAAQLGKLELALPVGATTIREAERGGDAALRNLDEQARRTARHLALGLAVSLDEAACRALTGEDPDALVRLPPALKGVSACRWRPDPSVVAPAPRGPDAMENLAAACRGLYRETGRRPDRVTMGTPDFEDLCRTESFLRLWRGQSPPGFDTPPGPDVARGFVSVYLQADVRLTDRHVTRPTPDGPLTAPVLPARTVLIDSAADDSGEDGRVLYFGTPTAALVAALLDERVFAGPGPFAYYEVTRRALPAHIRARGAVLARALLMRPCAAVLTV